MIGVVLGGLFAFGGAPDEMAQPGWIDENRRFLLQRFASRDIWLWWNAGRLTGARVVTEAGTQDRAFMTLVRTIAAGDEDAIRQLLMTQPALAQCQASLVGATRQTSEQYYFKEIGHYLYRGDTALHIAAAAYNERVASRLIEMDADVRARNRRGAEPLHYAADGAPASPRWNPDAQAAVIRCLLKAGADPNCADKSGVRPLHRAVRTRCAAAVRALLEGGADAKLPNKNGSTPLVLATLNTGRGGSGMPEARAQQQEILDILRRHGAT